MADHIPGTVDNPEAVLVQVQPAVAAQSCCYPHLLGHDPLHDPGEMRMEGFKGSGDYIWLEIQINIIFTSQNFLNTFTTTNSKTTHSPQLNRLPHHPLSLPSVQRDLAVWGLQLQRLVVGQQLVGVGGQHVVAEEGEPHACRHNMEI